jgi:hypothetical protein
MFYDIFREIQIENIPDSPRLFAISIKWISLELLFICDHHWDPTYKVFHLTRLDLHQAKLTFLHSQRFDGPIWDIIFDKNDRNKIALWSMNNRQVPTVFLH